MLPIVYYPNNWVPSIEFIRLIVERSLHLVINFPVHIDQNLKKYIGADVGVFMEGFPSSNPPSMNPFLFMTASKCTRICPESMQTPPNMQKTNIWGLCLWVQKLDIISWANNKSDNKPLRTFCTLKDKGCVDQLLNWFHNTISTHWSVIR